MSYLGRKPDRTLVRFKLEEVRRYGEVEPKGRIVFLDQGTGEFSVFVEAFEVEKLKKDGGIEHMARITIADRRLLEWLEE